MISSAIIPQPLARLPWRLIFMITAIAGFARLVHDGHAELRERTHAGDRDGKNILVADRVLLIGCQAVPDEPVERRRR